MSLIFCVLNTQECKRVPQSSLQTFHQICTFLLCVWNSFPCPCGVRSHLVRKDMFIGVRGLAKPYSTDKSRVCSTLPDSVSNLVTRDTATRNSAASANFITSLWYGFPKQSSNAVFLLPFTWYLSSNHPACLTNHGHASMAGVTSIERRVSNSRRKHPTSPSTASCARPTAQVLCLLNLGAVSTLSWIPSTLALTAILSANNFNGFWINLQNTFRIRDPFDECSAHR